MKGSFRWDHPSSSAFDSEGRIQPLNCNKNEISNRIITVGDPNRAMKVSAAFDKDFPVIVRNSPMLFTTYTGKKNGVLISVIATGMGFTMIELLVVQARALLEGPIYMIRFGTCGSLSPDVPIGCFAITNRSYGIRIDYEKEDFPYEFTNQSIDLDSDFCQHIYESFTEKMPQYRSVIGPVWSADTFYGSQGRLDDNFINNNENIFKEIFAREPESLNFEMEAYVMAFLCNKYPEAQIKCGAVCITLAQRSIGSFLDNKTKETMESAAADSLLSILEKI